MEAAQPPSNADSTDAAEGEQSQVVPFADTIVQALPEAQPIPEVTTTPSQGTALPPVETASPGLGPTSGYHQQVEITSEPLGEMDDATIALSRPADLLSIVRQWPRATLAAIIAAVVFPFILVISIVSLVGNGATDNTLPVADDAGASQTEPDASSLASISPPLTPTADSSVVFPVSEDGGESSEEVEAPAIDDGGFDVTEFPEALPPIYDSGPESLPPSTEPVDGNDGPSKGVAMARLSVTTSPGKLRVYIDNRSFGTSPVTAPLRPGSHRVTVRGSSIDHSVQVRLAPGERRTERIIVPNGELALVIRPYADVYIDGRHVGLTPRPPVKLAPGRHRIRLVNNDLNRSVLRTVTIRPGKRSTLTLNMGDTP